MLSTINYDWPRFQPFHRARQAVQQVTARLLEEPRAGMVTERG